MDKAAITNLQQLSVANITDQLPALDRESLIELAAQEAAGKAPRATLQAAIDKQLIALDAADEGGAAAERAPAAENDATEKAAPKSAPAKITKDDFRHPDYAGPLNGEQAAWRVRNIKPAAAVTTK